MNILITGAKGFVGRNLTVSLENIRDGKDRTHPGLNIDHLYLYDVDSTFEELKTACAQADYVFNLAGVNRPKDNCEFTRGNLDFTKTLLSLLSERESPCPVMLSSSTQASLVGRFEGSEYGKSKRAAEEAVFEYSQSTGASVYVYRFPNLFGKWCRPNYNSAVATFCHNIANDLDIVVNDPSVELELLYIDDLVDEMISLLEGGGHRCNINGLDVEFDSEGRYFAVETTYRVTLGEIVSLLREFSSQPETLMMPSIPMGSFSKKLYSTYLSYLPERKVSFPLKMNVDARGSFTEMLKTSGCGQFSVNVSLPGITKGQHWHHSKWEFFIVVYGQALIQQRKIGTDEVLNFRVSGDEIQAVHMLPGYTHNIINLSDTDKLITVMWANESFDPDKPDTFFEVVE